MAIKTESMFQEITYFPFAFPPRAQHTHAVPTRCCAHAQLCISVGQPAVWCSLRVLWLIKIDQTFRMHFRQKPEEAYFAFDHCARRPLCSRSVLILCAVMKALPEDVRQSALRRLREGRSTRSIASELHTSQATVARLRKVATHEATIKKASHGGRPRV